MALAISFFDALLASVFMLYGLNFFVMGMLLLGRGTLKDAAPIFLAVGGVNGIIGLIYLNANLMAGNGTFALITLQVLVFAVTWLGAGMVGLTGGDSAPLGSLGIFNGLIMVPFVFFFILSDDIPGRIWLTVNSISWVYLFFTLPALFLWKVMGPKAVGWGFIIQAFYTLWIPASLIITGIGII